MAISSVVLDIKTNTERALNDFKRFSSQLDNKFLVSGLKLDVVRSALGQINREFQKAIGEQGLTAGQSLRAAQNQASLLTQTFKSFSSTASMEMAQQFSSAFSQIAVTAGGTAQDIQKALAATPFISTNLSADMSRALGKGVLDFQKDFRRAGVTEDFGGIAKQFLAGRLSAKQMMESGDAGQSFIGNQLMKSSGGAIDTITNSQQRSEALLKALSDPKFQKQLAEMAKSTSGFKSIIEDLNSTLFNPEAGIFGSLRQVAMSIKDKTTVFDETRKLIESVFGREGLFVNFFKQIGKIFGIEDPLKVIIIGIRFITRQFDALNRFIQSPAFQDIVKKIREVFDVIKSFFTKLYNRVIEDFGDPTSLTGQVKQIGIEIGDFFKQLYTTISTGAWDPTGAVADIRSVGKAARKFIEQIGKSFRDMDVEKQGSLFLEIFKTMVGEVAQTLGTAIKEAILSVFSGKGAAVLGGVISVLYEGLSKLFTGLFGGNGAIGAVLGGTAMAGLGVLLARRIRGVFMSILGPIQAMRAGGGGIGGFANRLLGGGQGDRNLEGGRMGFQAQVISHLQRIANCVCGPGGLGGGGGPIDLDADTPESRRERSRTGRGPRGGQMPRRAPLTTLDTINPSAYSRGAYLPEPDVRSSYLKAQKEARRNYIKGTNSSKSFDLYTESLGGVSGPAADLDVDQRRLAVSRNLERPENIEVEERTRQRYKQRFGRKARFGRAFKGLGKGALIAGGIGLASAALFGGGSAQASELDPATGQPQVGAGEAYGRVGMGALEGASTGAMIGSIIPGVGTALGAGIGGAIGAAVQLFDGGVRDAIGKSLSQFATNMGNNTRKLWDGLISNVMRTFDGIKSFAGSIDWKTVLINALIPGGQFTIQGLQSLGQFASKLNIFDGIKSGIDAISTTASNILRGDWLPNPFGGKKEAGGTVIRGTSYIVGERGPEIYTPGASGSISTNRDLMAMRSGSGSANSPVSASFNISINVNGGMGAGDVEMLRGPVLRIVEEAWASATQGTISRGAVG